MKYKKIPFYYDWDNIMSRLQNDDEYEDVTLELDDDILILKDMKEIPWCVNGNQKCSDFGNSECSIFGIKTTVLFASAVQ